MYTMHTSDVHGRKIKEEKKIFFPSVFRWPHVLCMHRNSKMAVDSLLCFCSHRTVLYPPHCTILEVIYGPVFCFVVQQDVKHIEDPLGITRLFGECLFSFACLLASRVWFCCRQLFRIIPACIKCHFLVWMKMAGEKITRFNWCIAISLQVFSLLFSAENKSRSSPPAKLLFSQHLFHRSRWRRLLQPTFLWKRTTIRARDFLNAFVKSICCCYLCCLGSAHSRCIESHTIIKRKK
jgi:hypothetical protein